MKAILYARVSSARNRCRGCQKLFLSADDLPVCPDCYSTDIEKSQDTQNQLRVLRSWMQEQHHEVVAEYVDRASGKSGDRDRFKQMFVDLEARNPRTPILIGFWSLDRLSREGVLETLQYLQQFTRYGAEWKSYTEQFLDSTGIFREAIIAIFAALAKQQRVRIAENTKAGLQRAMIEGTKSGKPVGRPNEIDLRVAREIYLKTGSYRATGRQMGVSGNAVRFALAGRPEQKPKPPDWSPPLWGIITGGEFLERPGGNVVVRYDNNTGIPWCINHQKRVADCAAAHEAEHVRQK